MAIQWSNVRNLFYNRKLKKKSCSLNSTASFLLFVYFVASSYYFWLSVFVCLSVCMHMAYVHTRRMAIASGTCVSFCNQPKAHFGLPWVRPWDNRGKYHLDEKRIQCWSNASLHVSIYLQPFTSYNEILVGNCNFFLPTYFFLRYPLYLTPQLGVFPLEFREKFGSQKTRIMELPGSEDSLTIGWAVSTWPACDGQTDGQTSSLYQ